MNENIKEFDYFATRLLNPDKGVDALIVENINPTTASLETRDTYKNTKRVQEMFTDDHGNFDNVAYNKFYDQVLIEYSYLSAVNTENYILDNYEKAASNFSTPFGKIKTPQFSTEFVENTDKLSFGFDGFNEW